MVVVLNDGCGPMETVAVVVVVVVMMVVVVIVDVLVVVVGPGGRRAQSSVIHKHARTSLTKVQPPSSCQNQTEFNQSPETLQWKEQQCINAFMEERFLWVELEGY